SWTTCVALSGVNGSACGAEGSGERIVVRRAETFKFSTYFDKIGRAEKPSGLSDLQGTAGHAAKPARPEHPRHRGVARHRPVHRQAASGGRRPAPADGTDGTRIAGSDGGAEGRRRAGGSGRGGRDAGGAGR